MQYLVFLFAILCSDAFAGQWKAVEMSGDNSIKVFDNARVKVGEILGGRGVETIGMLSATRTMQKDGVLASSAANLEKALNDLKLEDDDSCLIFMTSHGSKSGFYIAGQPTLTPAILGGILKRTCGDRVTVMLVSSCYSGVQIDNATVGANRIIITAARRDRTSFGCGSEETYTYWDTCLVALLPEAKTWEGLHESIKDCVTAKEGGFKPSLPQISIGQDVKDLEIP